MSQTGFLEIRYEKEHNSNETLVFRLMGDILRVYENGKKVFTTRNPNDHRYLLDKYPEEHDYAMIFMASEDSQENVCDCWKKGLE